MVLKMDKGDLIKREVMANIIGSEEVTFLCGEQTLMEWKTVLDFTEQKLGFKEQEKNVVLIKGSHLLAKLELVGRWKDDDAVFLVEKDEDAKSYKGVEKIHNRLNHKQKETMYYTYRNTGKLDEETKKLINKVVEKYGVCKEKSKSKSKPSVAIPRASDFNSVVAIDLKSVGDRYILWMVCTFTKFVKGAVINDKHPETGMKALHQMWCMD